MERLERWCSFALVALGALVFADFWALAAAHVGSLFAVNQTSGAWMSYAHYFREGIFYPPLTDAGYYAGTRYFPGYFVVHGLLGRFTGELLVAGKLTSYASAAVAFAALVDAIRRRLPERRAGWPAPILLAIAAASVFFAGLITFRASVAIRGDILPLALSLAALTLLERSAGGASSSKQKTLLVTAAVLAALAPLAKFTSLHALTAGAAWLFFVEGRRRDALLFAGIGALVFLLGIGAVEAASAGRFSENLRTTAVAPPEHAQGLLAALETYSNYARKDRVFLVLVGGAALAIALERHRPSVFALFVPLHAVIAVGFYFDTGAEQNHLADLAAGALVLTAGLLAVDRPRLRVGALAALGFAAVHGLATEHAAAWAAERTPDVRRFVDEALGLGGKSFLSHDPTIAVLAGRRPVIADDFQFRVLVLRGLIPEDELPRRIAAREFERIVLLNPPEPGPDATSFTDLELGEGPARAIRRHYELERHVGRWYVFKPRG